MIKKIKLLQLLICNYKTIQYSLQKKKKKLKKSAYLLYSNINKKYILETKTLSFDK